jgi:hypothetical protein
MYHANPLLRARWALLGLALPPLLACEPARLPARATINQPQALAFRCVAPEGGPEARPVSGRLVGLPLEDCGCTVREPDGTLRTMGRVECRCALQATLGGEKRACADSVDNDADGQTDLDDADCRRDDVTGLIPGELGVCANGTDDDADGLVDFDDPGCAVNAADYIEERRVRRIAADCTPGDDGRPACTPRRDPDTRDFIPVFDPAAPADQVMACTPAEQGSVRAYVGASGRGEVAVLDVGSQTAILDVDRSIPGTTSIYVDDLVSDIAADPDGRFVFTVNSSTGSISVVRHDDVSVAVTVELADEPLFEVAVFPDASVPREWLTDENRRLGWLSAPLSGRIFEIDLDVLAGLPASRNRIAPPEGLVRRIIELAPGAPGEPAPRVGRMAADGDARWLYVTHRDERAVTVLNLAEPSRQQRIALAETRCNDGYLTDLVDPRTLCRNGLDDDGDGAIDAADPECAAGETWEGGAADACFRLDRCANGVDDDDDGDLDAADTDCQGGGAFEGPVPACANGLDDDGDGVADRADPDCVDERDDDERGRELSTCADGLDNDGNGLVDTDDPTCQEERCDDGEDNRERDADDELRDTEDPECARPDAGPAGETSARFEPGLPEEGGGRARSGPLAADSSGDPGTTPCTNATDDDGDGLTDADDPGCRFFSATRRYAFEAVPACADGVDNDRDGRVDFPDDPECYAAADSNEGGDSAATGTADVVGLRFDAGAGRVLRTAYVLDRAVGEIVALDFGEDAAPRDVPRQRVLDAGGVLQSMALRQTPESAALITADEDGNLGTVELYGPRLVVDREGRPVFARIAEKTEDGRTSYFVEHFYVVAEGRAWLATGLEAYRESTGGDLLTPSQTADLANGLVPEMLTLPVAPVVDSRVAVDGKEPRAITVWAGEDDPSPRGALDPLVAVANDRALLEARTNTRSSAASRTNRLAGSPTLFVGETTTIYDPDLRPAFCRLGTESEEGCLPQGWDTEGRPEDPAAAEARTAQLVQGSEAIRITEDAVEVLPADTFSLAYEGVLPGTDSKSGLFGGAEVDENTWSLVDYERDYCRLGVEPGDVVVVESFVGVTSTLSPECAALAGRAAAYGDPRRHREPIRYTVDAVDAHRLVLSAAAPARRAYDDQVPADPRIGLPAIPEPAPVPAAACAAQYIRYRVRAQDDQWLLTGARSGLRHPWVSVDGRCEANADRVERKRTGRVTLGVPFENEWFRFTLGYLAKRSADGEGVPEGLRPYQLDTRYEFTTSPGRQFNTLVGEVVLPRAMYWLPVDDRLYVVDTALGTVAEFTGFEPYRNRLRLVRRYD